MSHTSSPPTTNFPTRDVLRRWQWRWLLVGVAAAVVAGLQPVIGPGPESEAAPGLTRANLHLLLQSYLMAFVYWTGISVACLALAMLHQLVNGVWGLATARLFEAGGGTLPLMAVLFIPLALGASILYPWANDDELRQVFGDLKAWYLSETGFVARSLFYFAVWILFSWRLRSWTLKRDGGDSERLTLALRRLSAGGLLALGLTYSFAVIDWLMTLEPLWYSTIYGGMVGMGALLAAFALILTVLARVEQDADYRNALTPDNYNDLGNLLLAFVILWTYLAYSQYLIIWAGDTLEEIDWYLRRLNFGWNTLSLLIVGLHFVLPFFLLLSRNLKRDPRALARVACLLLVMDYIHMIWLVAPAFRQQAYRVGNLPIHLPQLHWLDFVMPLAVGGFWLSLFFWQAARRPLASPHDPAWHKLEDHEGEHHG